MTREEAIRCLEICKKYIDKIRASEGVEVSKELCMALDMAIKSLEQKPINSILDKIKDEMDDIAFDLADIDCARKSRMVVDMDDTFEIIDKYKAESEVEE